MTRLFSGFPHLRVDPFVTSGRKSTGQAFTTGIVLDYGWVDRSSLFSILKRRAVDFLKTHHLHYRETKVVCRVHLTSSRRLYTTNQKSFPQPSSLRKEMETRELFLLLHQPPGRAPSIHQRTPYARRKALVVTYGVCSHRDTPWFLLSFFQG